MSHQSRRTKLTPTIILSLMFSVPPAYAAAILDQINAPPWYGGWINIQGGYGPQFYLGQSFVPSLPWLVAVEVGLLTANPDWAGDTVTLRIVDGGQVLTSVSQYVENGFDGFLRFDLPTGGVPVTPGNSYVIQVEEGQPVLFGWRYSLGDTYPAGTMLFGGVPPSNQNDDFFFRTYGDTSAIPEPSSVLMIGGGLIGLLGYCKCRRQVRHRRKSGKMGAWP